MTTVNIHEAKTHLSALLKRVAAGEDVVIAKAGRPVAKLVRVAEPKTRRIPGSAKGLVWIADDFDEMPEDLLKLFEEGEVFPDGSDPK